MTDNDLKWHLKYAHENSDISFKRIRVRGMEVNMAEVSVYTDSHIDRNSIIERIFCNVSDHSISYYLGSPVVVVFIKELSTEGVREYPVTPKDAYISGVDPYETKLINKPNNNLKLLL